MSSKLVISGDIPPCTHRNCWFKRAARGRQSNVSIHASYTCSEYLIRPIKKEKQSKEEKLQFIIYENGYWTENYEATSKPFISGKFENNHLYKNILEKLWIKGKQNLL